MSIRLALLTPSRSGCYVRSIIPSGVTSAKRLRPSVLSSRPTPNGLADDLAERAVLGAAAAHDEGERIDLVGVRPAVGQAVIGNVGVLHPPDHQDVRAEVEHMDDPAFQVDRRLLDERGILQMSRRTP